MAVAYDATGTGVGSAGDAGWTHVIGSSANAILIGVLNNGFGVPSGVTVGTHNATQVGTGPTFYSGYYLSMWKVDSPPTGSQTISVTGSGFNFQGCSVSFSGVTGYGTAVVNTGTTTSVSASVSSGTGHRPFVVMGSIDGSGLGSAVFSAFSGTSRFNNNLYPHTGLLLGDTAGVSTTTLTATAPYTDFGVIAVDVQGTGLPTAAANLTGAGVLSATAIKAPPRGAVSGHGALSAVVSIFSINVPAALHGAGRLVGTIPVHITTPLTGHGQLVGTIINTNPVKPITDKLATGHNAFILAIGDSTMVGVGDNSGGTSAFPTSYVGSGWTSRFADAIGAYFDTNVNQQGWINGAVGWNAVLPWRTSPRGSSAPTLVWGTGAGAGTQLQDGSGNDESVIAPFPYSPLITPNTLGMLPDLLIMNDGHNDFVQPPGHTGATFAANYQTFIANVRALAPTLPILILTQNAAYWDQISGWSPLSTILVGQGLPLNPVLQYSLSYPGVYMLDTQQAFPTANTPAWSAVMFDGLHPNTLGYDLWAQFMLAKLAPVVLSQSPAAALSGRGVLSATTKTGHLANLSGRGTLTATAIGRPTRASGATGHGRLSAAVHIGKINLHAALAGRGTLTTRVTPSGTHRLTFFPLSGTFIAVSDPAPFGADPTPVLEPIQALITFTPRLPVGAVLYVSQYILSEGSVLVAADTAVVVPALTARIWDGVLSTIDHADTPGFQLVANSGALNFGGTDLIYDVTFDKVTFNGTHQVLAPFSFAAPTDTTPVDITASAGPLTFTAAVSYGPTRPAVVTSTPRPQTVI